MMTFSAFVSIVDLTGALVIILTIKVPSRLL